ncbi:hypothetical protein PF008_g28502 [Phytophthora fragariae]|uniref:Crinkler effector protein N-terminal domain-containing protein n=1 Tax=Phytophthora fragariae TaxID=53985 RepID=A0A6G0QB57_9STRA|nr:hypothetical protein PF008_g28502 [Phytophthora fragariae]
MLLWCVVVGSCAEAFPVTIKPSGNVRQLFDSIKSINSPMFSGIDFSKVELFLAKDMDGEWLHADAPEMSWLMYGEEKIVDLVCRNVLDAETKLEELFKSDPRGDQTQIVVQIVEYPEEEQNGKTLELQCLVVGGANRAPFVARVKDTNDFHKLKRNIIASSPKDFYLLATSDLHLYLAQNRQREWLAEDHPDVAALCKGDSSALDVWLWNLMHPSSKIGNQFNSVGSQVIHVLISRPTLKREIPLFPL